MKKILILGILFFSLLLGDTPIEVEKTGKYLIGEAHYNSKNFDSSLKIFEELFQKNSDNTMINYYLGMNYMAKQDYDKAVGAFERVLIVDPMFHRARLEYAVALSKTNQREQAKEELKKVLVSPIPEVVRKNVENLLSSLEKADDIFVKNGIFMLGMNYDSNYNNGLDNTTFTIPRYNVQVNGSKSKSASAWNGMLLLNFAHNNKSEVKLDHTLLYYTKRMSSSTYHERDLMVYSYAPNIKYKDFGLGFSFDKIQTGDNNDFLNLKLSPAYSLKLDDKSFLKATINLSRQLYDESDDSRKELDERELDTKYGYENYTLGAIYGRDFGRENSSLDKKYYGGKLSVNLKLSYGINSTLSYDYLLTQYNEEDIWFFSKRKDTKQQLSLNNTKIFDKLNMVSIYMNFTDNSSNQAPYEYDKYVVGANYMRSFTW